MKAKTKTKTKAIGETRKSRTANAKGAAGRGRVKAVEFECHAPEAGAIFVAGTFNDWNPQVLPMVRGENGHWTASLDLARGNYEYKFVVDGEWTCNPGFPGDESNSACVWNAYGTTNRVLEVSG